MRSRSAVVWSTVFTMLLAGSANAEPFTYQAYLEDSGAPASGQYDVRFELYNFVLGGTPVQTAEFPSSTVTRGLVQVELPDTFADPDNRWIQISIRSSGSGDPYTVLSNRKMITAAPFASVDLNEPWTPWAQGITHGNGSEVVLINRSNRIGSEYFGVGADTDFFAGMYISTTGINGRPFYGYSAGGGISAYHYFDGATSELKLVMPTGTAIVVDQLANTTVLGDLAADNLGYNTPRTRYVSVSPVAFRPNDLSATVHYRGGYGYPAHVTDAGSLSPISAPLSLPDGATITELNASLREESTIRNLSVAIYRVGRSSVPEPVASLNTTPAGVFSGAFSTSSITNPVVDNQDYTYHVQLSVGGNGWAGNETTSVSFVRVAYTVSEPD
ncbi:MAG: hypothetical protein KC996_07385 [Phycisphaerales bacterium]|nr:hypothetical protein [Phycisphaerales bacterium]